MRGQEIVAWSQCRQANGELKNFVGHMEDITALSIASGEDLAIKWAYDVKGAVKNTVDDVVDLFVKGTDSGDTVEYIPAPAIQGTTTINQQWQKILSIHGFALIYGISISATPDSITPPVPPIGDPAVMGSVVLTTALFEPPQPYYSVSDMGSPRFDFTHVRWHGIPDKPVTPLASPWQLGTDTFVNPNQLEAEIWNVNIPIAKHRIPQSGLGVWAYWNSMSPPKLNVRLITAPGT